MNEYIGGTDRDLWGPMTFIIREMSKGERGGTKEVDMIRLGEGLDVGSEKKEGG